MNPNIQVNKLIVLSTSLCFVFLSLRKGRFMETFIRKIREVYPLSDTVLNLFLEQMEFISLPKGHVLIREGTIEKYTYFIVKGFARGFFYKEGKEVTIWFASEGMSLLSMNAYLFDSVGYENIELVEECALMKISNKRLNALFEQEVELANWGRRMSDRVVLKLEQMFMERYFLSAARRYHLLVDREPEILQKVPLRHIASYLGVSQVSLSRIRAGIQ